VVENGTLLAGSDLDGNEKPVADCLDFYRNSCNGWEVGEQISASLPSSIGT